MKFAVAQIGARMHYAVPRFLHGAGLLERFFTDICAVSGWPRLLRLFPPSFQPQPVRRLLGRVPVGVPVRRITAFNRFGQGYALRQRRARTAAEATAVHLWAGREFCRLILRAGIDNATGVFAMSSAALELLVEAERRGIRTVLEQPSAPCAVELSIMEREHCDWPGWEEPRELVGVFDEFSRREQQEWEHADIIICPSQFVAEGIRQSGGPSQKCRIVPYGVDIVKPPCTRDFSEVSKRPLRVLTVGAVRLQKGAQYVLEAAQRIQVPCDFKWVGPLKVGAQAESLLRSKLHLTGTVPRCEVQHFYDWADLFLLPSLSEGSATVVYEALASGVPVICTPNTGSVVRDGADGFIVPTRDSAAIAERLEELSGDPHLLADMAENAYARGKEFSLAAYAGRFLEAVTPNACS